MFEIRRSAFSCLHGALVAIVFLGLGSAKVIAGPARTLPAIADADVTITVRIDLETPSGTAVVGVEDAPPVGWTASNISDGGSWDAVNERVKWGLFFEPSIPAFVTYDLTIPQAAAGQFCFDGIVSFDGNTVTIAGDLCVPVAIPAVSTWGFVILALLLLCVATRAVRLRSVRVGIV